MPKIKGSEYDSAWDEGPILWFDDDPAFAQIKSIGIGRKASKTLQLNEKLKQTHPNLKKRERLFFWVIMFRIRNRVRNSLTIFHFRWKK